ncbi:MAG: RIP metalloprotease RseP, partial [bacterium]|nr:RIP metalloprotease RseP [bacterium]
TQKVTEEIAEVDEVVTVRKRFFLLGNTPPVDPNSTVYSINSIPFGGFVKILGENGENAEKGSFSTKPVWQRFIVLVAGVSMNMILAWLLLTVVLSIGLPSQITEGETLPKNATMSSPQIMIQYVEPDSPAGLAGLRPGDVVLSVEGNAVETVQQLQDYTGANAGRKLRYQLLRGAETYERDLIPRVSPPSGQGPLGIQPALTAKIKYPVLSAAYHAIGITLSLAVQILIALGQLIKSLFGDRSLLGSLTGPVGIAVMTHQAAKLGLSNLIYFTSVLSVNLAIINVLPFPALDGGRILFLFIEKLRRRKLAEKFENYANTMGFLLLISLVIWITTRDVGRFSSQFFELWRRIVNIF